MGVNQPPITNTLYMYAQRVALRIQIRQPEHTRSGYEGAIRASRLSPRHGRGEAKLLTRNKGLLIELHSLGHAWSGLGEMAACETRGVLVTDIA